jgi:Spy/CpxP family protein refolding chaperone
MKNHQKLTVIAAMVVSPLLFLAATAAQEASAESDLRREVARRQILESITGRYERTLGKLDEAKTQASEIKARIEDEQKITGSWQTVDGQQE